MIYYNEYDSFAANWIKNLIKEKHLPEGEVDERDIRDVSPKELKGYTQCHFFAGIGGWSYALKLAGWPIDKPVWTGSCPCQPFSTSGSRSGFADERHLWPSWYWLIKECKPEFLFGEQVASKSARAWFDIVQADLEKENYTTGANDLCSCSVGAPHIRQRIYWVAYSASVRCNEQWNGEDASDKDGASKSRNVGNVQRGTKGLDIVSGLAHFEGTRQLRKVEQKDDRESDTGTGSINIIQSSSGLSKRLAHNDSDRYESQFWKQPKMEPQYDNDGRDKSDCMVLRKRKNKKEKDFEVVENADRRPTNGVWSEADWLFCRDGRLRPVEPGTFPMDYGIPKRVGRLRGYGNAINPHLSAEFIKAFMSLL